jgi:hypothetical protein
MGLSRVGDVCRWMASRIYSRQWIWLVSGHRRLTFQLACTVVECKPGEEMDTTRNKPAQEKVMSLRLN